MATDKKKISEAVEMALAHIANNAPGEYSKLTAFKRLKYSIKETARKIAKEQVKLSHEFECGPQKNIRERLAKHLPEDRIKLIEEALFIPTFRMEISKPEMDNGKSLVEIKRGQEEFLPSRELAAHEDINWAMNLQHASIVVEAVMFVMQAAGIKVSVSGSTMKETVEDTGKAIEKSSAFQQALQKFVSTWKTAGNSATERAKAIFFLLKDTYVAGLLWTIIKSLCKETKWYDWLETTTKVSAMIVTALATDGAALIAEIALTVLATVDFARKIDNVVQQEEIRKTLQEERDHTGSDNLP